MGVSGFKIFGWVLGLCWFGSGALFILSLQMGGARFCGFWFLSLQCSRFWIFGMVRDARAFRRVTRRCACGQRRLAAVARQSFTLSSRTLGHMLKKFMMGVPRVFPKVRNCIGFRD